MESEITYRKPPLWFTVGGKILYGIACCIIGIIVFFGRIYAGVTGQRAGIK